MNNINKVLYLMAKRDAEKLEEGLKANIALTALAGAAALAGGTVVGKAISSARSAPEQPSQVDTPPKTPATPPTPAKTPAKTSPAPSEESCVGPNCKRLLDTLSYTEGTDRYPNGGYYTQFGGKQFTDTTTHPNEVIRSKNGYSSTAAGRYQVLNKTFVDIGMKDMTPAEQDRGALALAQRRLKLKSAEELETYLSERGLDDAALDAFSREWASVTDSKGKGRYGQPTKTKEQIRDKFNQTTK